MKFIWDPLNTLNLVFCIIIVVLGYWAYKKWKYLKFTIPLYISVAFGLFGISHLATLFGYESSEGVLIVIRTLAYLIVIFALYKAAFKG